MKTMLILGFLALATVSWGDDLPVTQFHHISCGENQNPGTGPIQILKVCRSVLHGDQPDYLQDNYILFFYTEGWGSGVTMQDAWNVGEQEGQAVGPDWIISVYYNGEVPIVNDLGYWHDPVGTETHRWWMRGLSAHIELGQGLDARLGILSGDDPRGLPFRAEMRKLISP